MFAGCPQLGPLSMYIRTLVSVIMLVRRWVSASCPVPVSRAGAIWYKKWCAGCPHTTLDKFVVRKRHCRLSAMLLQPRDSEEYVLVYTGSSCANGPPRGAHNVGGRSR